MHGERIKIKTALQKLSNDSFTKYVSTLRQDDYSIWKPIKAKKKPQTPLPQSIKIPHCRGPGPKATQKKLNYSRTI